MKKALILMLALIASGCANFTMIGVGQRFVTNSNTAISGGGATNTNTGNTQEQAADKALEDVLSGNQVDASKLKKEEESPEGE